MKKKSILAYALLMLITLSCSDAVYEKHDKDSFVNFNWKRGQEVVFTPTIDNTEIPYTLSLAVRHVYGFPLNSIGVTVKSVSPSGKETTNRHELRIKESDLKYNSGCAGDICDFESVVNNNLTFEEPGQYRFIVTHNVPAEHVPGIMEVGLIIHEKK
jgi:gliding motility-associated lipoprotein GldH